MNSCVWFLKNTVCIRRAGTLVTGHVGPPAQATPRRDQDCPGADPEWDALAEAEGAVPCELLPLWGSGGSQTAGVRWEGGGGAWASHIKAGVLGLPREHTQPPTCLGHAYHTECLITVNPPGGCRWLRKKSLPKGCLGRRFRPISDLSGANRVLSCGPRFCSGSRRQARLGFCLLCT